MHEKAFNECYGYYLKSTSSDNKYNTDFMALVAYTSIINPLTTTSDVQEVISKDDKYKDADEHDELLDTYNALLLKHIKSAKDKTKAMKRLKEKKCEICALKKALEGRNSSVVEKNMVSQVGVRPFKKVMMFC